MSILRKIYNYWQYIVVFLFVSFPIFYYIYWSIEPKQIPLKSMNMDYSTIITLLTTISLIAAYIFNPVVNRKLKIISTKIDTNDLNNKKDHEILMNRLSGLEITTNLHKERTSLYNKFIDINIDSLKYSSDPNLSQYLNHDFDNYLGLVKYITSVGIVNLEEKDLYVKIKHIIDNNRDASIRYLNEEFTRIYFPIYKSEMSKYREDILKIKNDFTSNNKDVRYGALAETFLHNHISSIMGTHYKYKTHDKG